MDSRIFIISLTICFSLISNAPISIRAQINTPCSPSMLSTVTGCMSFLTGSGGNSPTRDCCESLKSLTGIGMDCLCLIVTASVPINLPINRTLAISLPRACGMHGVPVECKASVAPLPAPGPTSFPTYTQTSEGPASFGPVTPPANPPMDSEELDDLPESGYGDGTESSRPSPSLLPSSSQSLKLSILPFAFMLLYTCSTI